MIFLIAFAQAMDLFHCPCADNDKFHSNVNIYPHSLQAQTTLSVFPNSMGTIYSYQMHIC